MTAHGRNPDDEPLGHGASRAQIRAELDFYIEERAREFIDQGMTEEEAREAALRAFGDVNRIEEQVATARSRAGTRDGRMGMRTLIDLLRSAARGLVRKPAAALLVMATLGLGMGSATAIFSVADAALLQSLPWADSDRLVFVQGAFMAPEGPQLRYGSYPEVMDWRARATLFDGMAETDLNNGTLTGLDRPEIVQVEVVGEDYFDVLGGPAPMGRLFTPDEYTLAGAAPVAVISHGLWQRAWGGDPGILGTTFQVNGVTLSIAGVASPDFAGIFQGSEVWLPRPMTEIFNGEGALENRGRRYLQVVARLAPGVSVEAAQAEMTSIGEGLEAEYPEINADRSAVVEPVRTVFLGSTAGMLRLLLIATGLLLVLSAANVANLILIRTVERVSELRVRAALGAPRRTLQLQLLMEGLLQSAGGAVFGLLVGSWALSMLVPQIPDGVLPGFVSVGLDLRMVTFSLVLLATIGIVVGLAPARLVASETDGGSLLVRSGDKRTGWVQKALVSAQVAIASVLLIGATLVGRSLQAQLNIEAGYDAAELHAFSLNYPIERYDREGITLATYDILDRLNSDPMIESATVGSDAPLTGGSSAAWMWLPDRLDSDDRIRWYRHQVAANYLEVLGIDLLEGRVFDEAVEGDAGEIMLTRSAAERIFPGQSAIGKSLNLFSPENPLLGTVVGIVDDVRYRDLTTDLVTGETDPDVFLPWRGLNSPRVTFVLRTSADPAQVLQRARTIVGQVDADLAVADRGPMIDGLRAQTGVARLGSLLLGTFGVVALMLALIGMYGVLSYSVARRRREMAIRMALGAENRMVRGLIVKDGVALASLGLMAGVGAGVVGGRALNSYLYDITPGDPATFASVTILLLVAAAGATWLPALRAARTDARTAMSAD